MKWALAREDIYIFAYLKSITSDRILTELQIMTNLEYAVLLYIYVN